MEDGNLTVLLNPSCALCTIILSPAKRTRTRLRVSVPIWRIGRSDTQGVREKGCIREKWWNFSLLQDDDNPCLCSLREHGMNSVKKRFFCGSSVCIRIKGRSGSSLRLGSFGAARCRWRGSFLDRRLRCCRRLGQNRHRPCVNLSAGINAAGLLKGFQRVDCSVQHFAPGISFIVSQLLQSALHPVYVRSLAVLLQLSCNFRHRGSVVLRFRGRHRGFHRNACPLFQRRQLQCIPQLRIRGHILPD